MILSNREKVNRNKKSKSKRAFFPKMILLKGTQRVFTFSRIYGIITDEKKGALDFFGGTL